MAALVALAAGLGFGMGRLTAPSPGTTGAEPAGVESTAKSSPPRRDFADADTAPTAPSAGEDFSFRMAGEEQSAIDRLSATLDNVDPQASQRAMQEILAGMDVGKIKDALSWALALPDSPAKRSLLKRIMERWGQLDGPGAAAYGAELLAETGNVQPLRDALLGWGLADPGGALNYAQSLDLGSGVRRDIARDVLEQWADRNPQEAAAWTTEADAEVGYGGPVRLVADRWSQQDPRAALNWAMSLADGDRRRRALETSSRNWADGDLQTAAAYAKQQPDGVAKEAMIGGIARSIARLDPAAGMQWAASITDPGLQARTAMGVIWHSGSRNPDAALQLLQNSPLSPQVQQDLLTMITSGHYGAWDRPAATPRP